MHFKKHLWKFIPSMQNGAEMHTCAQAGAIIYLLSFNTLVRSQCSCLGYTAHLWTVDFSWMPYTWNLMVPFDTASANLFSHSDNLHFWFALDNLVGNLVINPEGSYMTGQNTCPSSLRWGACLWNSKCLDMWEFRVMSFLSSGFSASFQS